jgi:hypothetical protein
MLYRDRLSECQRAEADTHQVLKATTMLYSIVEHKVCEIDSSVSSNKL